MKFASVFKGPEGGMAAGIGTAIAVFLIYNSSLPPTIDVRVGPANDSNVEATRKGAAIKSGALIGLVFLFTHDLNAFIISGLSLGGIDYLYKHHNAFNPNTGKLEGANPTLASVPPMATLHQMPSYAESMG